MLTRFVEASQNSRTGLNWGKFLIGRFDEEEWRRRSTLPDAEGQLLIYGRGWRREHVLILDIQTGEGAVFRPGGSARVDLHKHKIWVCPMYEPFLEWLYSFVRDRPTEEGQDWFDWLPNMVELPAAAPAQFGYRREGLKGS